MYIPIPARGERWKREALADPMGGITGSVASCDRPTVPVLAERLVDAEIRSSQVIVRPAPASIPRTSSTTCPARGRAIQRGRHLTATRSVPAVGPLSPSLNGVSSPTCRGEDAVVEPELTADMRLAGTHLLLAEDNPTNQKVAARMLARLGCTFEVVADGAEALDRFCRAKFDLILMDVQMPRMDGYQATSEIRRVEAGCPTPGRIPIIAMTAHAMQGDRERCLAAQMDDYLSKPVTISRLAEMLGRWINSSRPVGLLNESIPEPPTPPVLRTARLYELSQGDVEFERDLLQCLLSDIAAGMARLHAALEPLDLVRVANTLHGIVGACRTVGAEDLAACCREREHQAKGPDFRPDDTWLAAIEHKRGDLIAAIAARIAS